MCFMFLWELPGKNSFPGGPSFTASYSRAGWDGGTGVGLGQDSQPCSGIPEERRDPSQSLIQTKKQSILPLASQLSLPCLCFSDCFLFSHGCLFVKRKGQGLIAVSPKLKEGGEWEDWRIGVRMGERERKKRGREGKTESTLTPIRLSLTGLGWKEGGAFGLSVWAGRWEEEGREWVVWVRVGMSFMPDKKSRREEEKGRGMSFYLNLYLNPYLCCIKSQRSL